MLPFDVVFVFRPGRRALAEAVQDGSRPDDMLYGAGQVDPDAFAVTLLERDDSRRNWFSPLDYQLSIRLHMGFSLPFALAHWRRLRRADVVVSTADALGLPMLLLARLGLLPTPIIYISQGLTDRFEALPPGSRTGRWLRPLYGWLLRRAARILVLGEGAKAPLIALFGLDAGRVFSVPFGVDADFWSPGADFGGGDFILSVGSDPARDYDTLLRALPPGVRLKLVTRQEKYHLAQLPPDVEVSHAHSDAELRVLYRAARLVVTPLQDVAQPAGQSATLQAMACAKTVILSATRGLWEPNAMRDGHNCILVPPGNADALRAALVAALADPASTERIGAAARQTILQRYTSRHFAAHLQSHIRAVLT